MLGLRDYSRHARLARRNLFPSATAVPVEPFTMSLDAEPVGAMLYDRNNENMRVT